MHQSAALCYRIKQGRPEVLLITTRKSHRWIIPKGWLIDGLTPSQTATQEAWEEAGVKGKCSADLLGRFTYLKNFPGKGPVLCLVDVFPLYVRSIVSDFPERDERKRKWVSPKKAASRVNFPELSRLLRELGPVLH
ncbi:NUDIX hydrolase [Ruegeria sp. Ofav3-42]|uniref:NUDIX hydrolase n=1 Tax=Ruegeria sp. Ofav3-42 TaxID=2917759 RepID=UPI001EF47BDC|nr:NUDIX hydrolase [Ruegeria sp. Ofav3-42]MCG7518762.1 NUDIX hydrolase [Ruegeria sp. Ofav3-42]